MKILVTGGAGYLGSILVPKLLSMNHEVTVLDSLMYGQTSLLDCCANPHFNMVRGDVRDERLVAEELKSADAVIALAALVGAPLCQREPLTSEGVNRQAIQFLAEKKSKDQILIYPCTNSGYGVGQEGIFCDETSPLKPISLYGKQKVAAEQAVLDSGSISFRLATVFGISSRMRLDLLVNDFTYRAVNDGVVVLFESHFKRNYIHVRDVTKAFVHGLENYDAMKGQAYNVGLTDANLSKAQLCETIQREVPHFKFLISEIGEDPDKRNYIVSNERIEATGYRPDHSLDLGIRELVKGFQIIRRNQFSNI